MKCIIVAESGDLLAASLQTTLTHDGFFVQCCHEPLGSFLNDARGRDTVWNAFLYIHPVREHEAAWKIVDEELAVWYESSVQRMFSTAQAIAEWCTARKTREIFVGVAGRSGGLFGRNGSKNEDDPLGACSGVFKSLHLEIGISATCVVDTPRTLPEEALSDMLIREFRSVAGFREVGYGVDGVRRQPVVRLLESSETLQEPLDQSDVLLVTGGGRGIAAEWALGLAKESGCKVALVGRTPVEGNGSELSAEVFATIRRFEDEQLSCRYYQCDVADRSSLQKTADQVRGDFGEITAVLHAAGTNIPQATRNLDRDVVEQTLAPKIRGTIHLLQTVSLGKVKLFVTFGSIIGQTGLAGQAAYAFANEWMNRTLLQTQREFPRMKCVSINSSVWAGAGMGHRLGSIDALAREGVTPIEPKAGVKVILDLLRRPLKSPETIVCGRVHRLPTLRFDIPPVPVSRFLERSRTHYPGVELIVECDLSTAHDPYLNDHFVNGMYLFPSVLGMEAMIQAASLLMNNAACTALEDLAFPRAIMISPDSSTRIRIIAQTAEDSRNVEIAIRSSETNFSADHFRGRAAFQQEQSPPMENRIDPTPLPAHLLPLSPKKELYGGILFQGPMFQHLAGYRELSATSCVAEISTGVKQNLFSMYQPQTLLTGDPTVRDTFLHAIQPCIPQAMILPLSIERIRFIQPIDRYATLFLFAREREHTATEYVFDFEVRSLDGIVVEVFEGFRCRAVGPSSFASARRNSREISPVLLAPYLERQLQSINLRETCAVAVTFDQPQSEFVGKGNGTRSGKVIGQSIRRKMSRAALERGIGDFLFKKFRRQYPIDDFSIEYTSDGSPLIRMTNASASGALYGSITHAGDMAIAIVADSSCACDLEKVSNREERVWLDLLGREGMDIGALVAAEMKEDSAIALTRVWTTMECLKKMSLNSSPLPVMGARDERGWVTFHQSHETFSIHTIPFIDNRSRILYVAALSVCRKEEEYPVESDPAKKRRRHAGI